MRIAKLSKSVQVSSETKIVMISRELLFDKKKIKTLQAMLFVFAGTISKLERCTLERAGSIVLAH